MFSQKNSLVLARLAMADLQSEKYPKIFQLTANMGVRRRPQIQFFRLILSRFENDSNKVASMKHRVSIT
jgi:hypothetical protein